MAEDADRHVGELVDCLMQSTRSIGFLIGAGCPCSIRVGAAPLIADIAGLTLSIGTSISAGPHSAAWTALLETFTDDGRTNPNLEEILDRVRGLASYVGVGQSRGLSRQGLADLEHAVCQGVISAARAELPDADNPYHALAVWVGSTRRSSPVELFTTNYDLLLEQALERYRVPYFDGFVGARRPFFDVDSVEADPLPPRWARVWKLHGSVNWQRDTARREIFRASSTDAAVIHPSYLKYDESRKMPYLAMMDRLRRFLKSGQPVLVTNGYAFRDQHVNEAIAESLTSNPSAVAFGLLYGPLEDYPEARQLAERCQNLRLHSSNKAIIGTREIMWREENQEPTSEYPAGIVSWAEHPAGSGSWRAELRLGDFARLGDLLYFVTQGRHKDLPGGGSA